MLNRLFGMRDQAGGVRKPGQADALDRKMLDLVIGGAKDLRRKLPLDFWIFLAVGVPFALGMAMAARARGTAAPIPGTASAAAAPGSGESARQHSPLRESKIIRLLREDPTVAGEPLYRLPALGLRMRTIAIAPLLIYFAVSEERPEVYLKSGKLLSPERS